MKGNTNHLMSRGIPLYGNKFYFASGIQNPEDQILSSEKTPLEQAQAENMDRRLYSDTMEQLEDQKGAPMLFNGNESGRKSTRDYSFTMHMSSFAPSQESPLKNSFKPN